MLLFHESQWEGASSPPALSSTGGEGETQIRLQLNLNRSSESVFPFSVLGRSTAVLLWPVLKRFESARKDLFR